GSRARPPDGRAGSDGDSAGLPLRELPLAGDVLERARSGSGPRTHRRGLRRRGWGRSGEESQKEERHLHSSEYSVTPASDFPRVVKLLLESPFLPVPDERLASWPATPSGIWMLPPKVALAPGGMTFRSAFVSAVPRSTPPSSNTFIASFTRQTST